MAVFDAAAIAAQAGEIVQGAVLAELAFASATMRLHAGFGPIRAGGQTWQGIGQLGAIGTVQQSTGGTAPSVTLTLSGTDPVIIRDVMNASAEIKGRPCRIFVQYFDADLAAIGDPYRVYSGLMDLLSHRMASADQWMATLTVVSRYARRGLPPFGNYSDPDQQARFPGDQGLYLMPAMQNRVRPWNPLKT